MNGYLARVNWKDDKTLDLPEPLLEAVSQLFLRTYRELKGPGAIWTVCRYKEMHPSLYEIGFRIVEGTFNDWLPFGSDVWFTEGLSQHGGAAAQDSRRAATFLATDKDALWRFLACFNLDLKVEEIKPYAPKDAGEMFMGNAPYSTLNCSAAHRLLEESFSTLGGMQQNGGMGHPFDTPRQEQDQARLVKIAGILNNALLGKPEKQEREMDECPKCHKNSVRAKGFEEGGGVECTTPGCGYWFCF